MGKELLLTKSNFKKNKGTCIGLFLLMLISTALIGVSLLVLLDAYPTAKREAERLDAGDGYIWLTNDIAGLDDSTMEKLFDGDVETFEAYHCLGYSNVSLPFGEGTMGPALYVVGDEVFETKMNRTEIVESDDSITKDYLYLPYQFFTSGGYEMGDTYSFELLGKKYALKVKGFINTTDFGCNNSGVYQFVFDDDNYDAIFQRDQEAAESIIVSFKLKDDVKPNQFKVKLANDVLKENADTGVYVGMIEDILFSKSFMSLIISVSFLIVTSVIVFVVVLMLANCISNYLKENMKTIGALKALGYTSRNIKMSLNLLFGLLSVVASMIGVGISYALMPVMSKIVVGQMGVPYTVSFNLLATIAPVVFEIVFVLFVTMLATRNIKKIDPILALRDGTKAHNFKKNRVALDKSVCPLNVSLALKTLVTNKKQNIITFFVTGLLVFICTIALLINENFNRNPKLGILTFETCGGVAAFDYETKEDALAFLEKREDVSNIRKMVNVNLNYNEEDSLLAYVFEDVSKMNNKEVCYKGRLPEYDNEIAVSGKFAEVYGYEIGDEIQMDQGDNSYRYLITGLIQTCNNYGREAVLSEEAAEHLVDFTYWPAYYWFDCEDKECSQEILDDCTEEYGEHVVSSMNFFEMIEGNMTTFKSIAILMLVLVCGIAVIVIALILYLLIKALLYNKRKDYGIYKALGYTSNSLIFQTALSFMPSIIVSVVVFSVVSYYTVNPYMSNIMGTFGLMKCTFAVPVAGVIVIGIGMIVIAFLMAMFQARKIKNIEAYNMLVGE